MSGAHEVPARRRHLRAQRGQGMLEFALVSIPLFLLLFGLIDFGILFESRLALDGGARAAARLGAVQPGSLSNASQAPVNTIQGRLQQTSGTTGIPNDDAHVSITYWTAGSSPTKCGSYSAATNSLTFTGGFTRASCLAPDNLVQVQVNYKYMFLTPMIGQLLGGSINVQTTASSLIEQPG